MAGLRIETGETFKGWWENLTNKPQKPAKTCFGLVLGPVELRKQEVWGEKRMEEGLTGGRATHLDVETPSRVGS